MKSYALCLSGQIRFIEESFQLINQNILQANNNDIDIFIHCWSTDKDQISKCIELYKPVKIIAEEQVNFDTLNYEPGIYGDGLGQKRVFNIMSMYYSIYKANQLSREKELENNTRYKYVARSRFDWAIREKLNFDWMNPTENEICTYNDCTHEYGCITDHFAFGQSRTMNIYASMFFNFDKVYRKDDFCSEVLLGRWLMTNQISIKHIPFVNRQFIYHPL